MHFSSGYSAPPLAWTPPYGPALSLGTRLYYPGPGGTIFYRTSPDSATGATVQVAFDETALCNANQIAFNNTVHDVVALMVFAHQMHMMNLLAHPDNVDDWSIISFSRTRLRYPVRSRAARVSPKNSPAPVRAIVWAVRCGTSICSGG